MGFAKITTILLTFMLYPTYANVQVDIALSPIPNITEVILKFIRQTSEKIDKYFNLIRFNDPLTIFHNH
jgi:hypothetical protein